MDIFINWFVWFRFSTALANLIYNLLLSGVL